jgi:hypothetical protein
MSKSLCPLVSIFANSHNGIIRPGGLGYPSRHSPKLRDMPASKGEPLDVVEDSSRFPGPSHPLSCRCFPDHSDVNLEGGLQLVEHALQGFHRV